MMRWPTEDPIEKKIPAGGVPARDLSHEARVASGAEPAFSSMTTPAAGPRPHPGPIPAAESGGPPADLRHQPIRWAFPWANNQVWTPRRGALTPFATLRTLADVSDITRICIETRKDQLCSMSWNITAREKDGGEASATRVREIQQFFARPDRRRDFGTWLRMAIEDVLVVDALSIYRRRTRGGGLFALELKDGATFLPLLDEDGDTPLPPKIAYRQIINGQPMTGGDCTVDQLMYRPRTVRTHTPYGLSPTEAVLLSINAALTRQVFNLQYYTEGNVPEGLLEAPEKFTTQQLIEFQEYLDDYLTGNLAARRRLKAVHHGAKVHEFKEPDFTGQYDEWLVKLNCAAFAVPPQEIGFTADVNKATGEQQENVAYRRGVKPLAQFFKGIFDEVIAVDLGAPDLEWTWVGGEAEDKLKDAQVDQLYVDMGALSVDDVRARLGKKPIGVGPYINTAMGPVFVADLLLAEPDDDPDTSEVESPDGPPASGADPEQTTTAEPSPAGKPTRNGKGKRPEAAEPETSLNGAQVKSLLEIMVLVSTGQLPRDAGVRAIMVAFNLSFEVADDLMGDIGQGFKPTPPPDEAVASDSQPKEEDNPDDDDETEVSEAATADLRRWRAVAIKCAKAGKPSRAFASDAIPLELHARVERFLARAGADVAKVVAAFELAQLEHTAVRKAGEYRQLTRAEIRASKGFHRVMKAHFRAQGKALQEHIRKGLEDA
jgi:hypothetical protein